MCTFYLESFLEISGFYGFSFLALEHTRKRGNYGKFRKFIFRGIKTIYDSEHFSKLFVCSGHNSHCVARSRLRDLTIES